MLHGWAMQEYAWQRGDEDGHARIDLAIEIKDLNLRFIAEAKQIYPNMRSRATTLIAAIDAEFRKLRSELDGIKPDNWARVSLVFVSPRIEDTTDLDAMIPEWVSTLCECPDACVWNFPVFSRTTAIQSPVTNMYYPGAALLVRHAPAPIA
jgi:hypothetical protein